MSIAVKDAAPTAPNKSQTSSRNVSTGKNANYIQNMCISLNQMPMYLNLNRYFLKYHEWGGTIFTIVRNIEIIGLL